MEIWIWRGRNITYKYEWSSCNVIRGIRVREMGANRKWENAWNYERREKACAMRTRSMSNVTISGSTQKRFVWVNRPSSNNYSFKVNSSWWLDLITQYDWACLIWLSHLWNILRKWIILLDCHTCYCEESTRQAFHLFYQII